VLGQYGQQLIRAIIKIFGIDQRIRHPDGTHIRHPFDDKGSLISPGGHCKNTHKITF